MITKDELIAQGLAQGKTQEQAYKMAFPLVTDDSARSGASRYIDKKPAIRQRAIDIVEQASGLTLMDALRGVKEGLSSTYTNKFGVQSDNATRLEATKLLLRIHGELKEHDTHTLIDNRSIHIELSPEYIDRVADVIQRFKDMKARPSVIDGEIVEDKAQDITDV